MAESSPNVLSMFETFRDELDQHHDRRERLIKTSRDITALSKKMYVSIYEPLGVSPYGKGKKANKHTRNSIFSLQRFVSQTLSPLSIFYSVS
jgi:predicted translin family RNA/ssDNA-binding protein